MGRDLTHATSTFTRDLIDPYVILREVPGTTPEVIEAAARARIESIDEELAGLLVWRGARCAPDEHLGRVRKLCRLRHCLGGYIIDPRQRPTLEEAREHLAGQILRVQCATARIGTLEKRPDNVLRTLSDVVQKFGSAMLSGAGREIGKATLAEVLPSLREHLLGPASETHVELSRKLVDAEARAEFMGKGSPSTASLNALRKHLSTLKTNAYQSADAQLKTLQDRAELGDPRTLFRLIEIAEAHPGALPIKVDELCRRLADALVASDPRRFSQMWQEWPELPPWQIPLSATATVGAGDPSVSLVNTWESLRR